MTAAHGVIVYKTDHVISDLSVSSFSLFVAKQQVVCPRVGTIFDNALRGSPKFRTVGKNLGWAVLLCGLCGVKLKFHWTDTDTCLLYTSPSPRDRQKSRMPSSA